MSVVVRDLRVELVGSGLPLVSDVGFDIAPGEVLGLVGESGSGKTTVSLAMLGYARKGTRIAAGSLISIDGKNLMAMAPDQVRAARGRLVSYVPQDPSASLNPAMTVQAQMLEVLRTGPDAVPHAEAHARMIQVLEEVSLPAGPGFLASYPSQLSGGQQQRVGIAMAVIGRPRLIVLDEPTTGLDASTQMDVLNMVGALCRAHGIAAIYVTHDLAVVEHVATRVLVLYAGRVVEVCTARRFFEAPAHPYSRALLNSLPSVFQRRRLVPIAGHTPAISARDAGCVFRSRCDRATPRCGVEPQLAGLAAEADHAVRCHFPHTEPWRVAASVLADPAIPTDRAKPLLSISGLSASYGSATVLRDINIVLRAGECVAIVGESGSGKSTLSRCIVGLHEGWSGEIALDGAPVAPASARRGRAQQQGIQYIFQNPYGSLNARRTIGASLAVAIHHFAGLTRTPDPGQAIGAALERVSLPQAYAHRYPNELSGGEKQRVAIARALVCSPRVLVCDEVTSALDVSVQAAIIELLRSLMADGLGILFVTHNLGVVRALSDRVAVLEKGVFVESGPTGAIIDLPEAQYTQHLIAHTLELGGLPAP